MDSGASSNAQRLPAPAILRDLRESWLLRVLHARLPEVVARLGDAAQWRGFHIGGEAGGYRRLVCRDELAGPGGRPRIVVAVHEFDGVDHGELHDHRFPLAVMPLAVSPGTGPLYRMPFERRGADGTVDHQGEHLVHSGSSYAIEQCRAVWHAVHSLRPHLSIVLSDVTEPPARADRLGSRPLPETVCAAILRRLRTAAQRSGAAGAEVARR